MALCDFGVARRITDETVTDGQAVMGSLIYISTQQRQNAHDAKFQDDVFSLGQVFFYTAAGINPHNAGPLAHHQNDHAAEIRALIEDMRHPTREGRPRDGTHVFLRVDGFRRRLAAGVVVSLGDISFRWGLGQRST